MYGRRVTVFGGSGFLGRYLVKRLAAAGASVRVPVRDIEAAKFLKPMGSVGQIAPVAVNVGNADAVRAAVQGSDDVVYMIGALAESGPQSFRRVHVDGPAAMAGAAAECGVSRVLLVSAIGADRESESAYARSKALGEQAVREAFPDATILRPSVVFGPEDDFFNRFAAMARLAPALPLIDGGRTRFQPVYVGDVADAAMAVLQDDAARGKTYELGGPQVMTFRDILAYVLRVTRRKRPLVPVPSALLRPLAGLMEILPAPPLTRDQLLLLRQDNVVAEGALKLEDLGVRPTPIQAEAPQYLMRYRRGGQFSRRSVMDEETGS